MASIVNGLHLQEVAVGPVVVVAADNVKIKSSVGWKRSCWGSRQPAHEHSVIGPIYLFTTTTVGWRRDAYNIKLLPTYQGLVMKMKIFLIQ